MYGTTEKFKLTEQNRQETTTLASSVMNKLL